MTRSTYQLVCGSPANAKLVRRAVLANELPVTWIALPRPPIGTTDLERQCEISVDTCLSLVRFERHVRQLTERSGIASLHVFSFR